MICRIKWRNGQVGWVPGGSGGSVWVMDEWSVVSGSMDSGCHEVSENVWFVWSKTSYSGDNWIYHRCRTTTREGRASQLLICEALSLAAHNSYMITAKANIKSRLTF